MFTENKPSTTASTKTVEILNPQPHYVKAVIVTHVNEHGTEHCFWYTEEGWYNGFTEEFLSDKEVLERLFCAQYVRFGDLKISAGQWVSIGIPMFLNVTEVEEMKAAQLVAEHGAVKVKDIYTNPIPDFMDEFQPRGAINEANDLHTMGLGG